MPKSKVSFTELAHQVVRESPEPLPFTEIMQRVHTITPITTKNPKNTIRNAVSQSRLIVATGDGRYGWKPRVITGSVLRLTLSESDLSSEALEFKDEIRDSLWPSFFEIALRSDETPVQVELSDNRLVTQFALDYFGRSGQGYWGTSGSPEFWTWLKKLGPAPGDHLIISVLDGLAKLYRVEFQPRSARDEVAIANRNQAIVTAAMDFAQKRSYRIAIWDLVEHLLCTGQYKHPIPPDPLAEVLRDETPIAQSLFHSWSFNLDEISQPLLDSPTQVYDYDNPPDLPNEYRPGPSRRPRPSAKAKKGPVKVFIFRVNHRALPQVWRDVELAEDQTLEDLHLIIQQAYDWYDDHLYSFFMSGRAWDKRSEIGSPWSESEMHTHQVTIGQLDLKPDQKFLYLFDYGDSHEFDVSVLRIEPAAPKGNYPKIVARYGKAPEQYPDYDEETGEMSWDPYWRP